MKWKAEMPSDNNDADEKENKWRNWKMSVGKQNTNRAEGRHDSLLQVSADIQVSSRWRESRKWSLMHSGRMRSCRFKNPTEQGDQREREGERKRCTTNNRRQSLDGMTVEIYGRVTWYHDTYTFWWSLMRFRSTLICKRNRQEVKRHSDTSLGGKRGGQASRAAKSNQ